LFDIEILFSKSYTTLTTPTKTGKKFISKILITDLLQDIDYIIPNAQTIELAAFASSLQQIKGINNLSIATIVKTANSLENTKDLTAVESSSAAVPASVSESLNNKYALGTDEGNKLLLADVLGTSIGYVHGDVYEKLVTEISTIASSLSQLITIIDSAMPTAVTANTARIAYETALAASTAAPLDTIKAATTASALTAYNAAKTAQLPFRTLLLSEVNNIIASNPALVIRCNKLSAILAKRIQHEAQFQADAKIALANLQHSNTAVLQFAKALHQVGNDKTIAGPRMILTQLITTATDGQTLIACMKEGQNIKQLQNNGLATDNFIKT
jgi:hypothetical protein